jgi:diguanylate cyclase (GGDEF)-like protein
MVDLDSFKGVNDTYGHLAGDRFLREITVTICEQLRGADLACRYGGDEFCLLLPESDPEAARAIGERIRTAVARRIVAFDGLALRTTVSVGVAAYPEHDTGSLQGLMQNADEALYRAKRSGRDRVVPFAA